MKRSIAVFAAGVFFAVGISGCNSAKKEATAPAPQAQTTQQPAAPVQAPSMSPAPAMTPAASGNSLSGTVVETMNSGGYTYVLIEKNGKKTWVAGPQTTVKVGQQVTCETGMEMKNFTSKTLKRTFDSIIFSGGIR